MKTRILFLMLTLLMVWIVSPAFCETTPSVNDNDLVKSLAKNLSIKPEQAAGGAGSIFNFAKGKLSEADFGKVSSAVPGMDSLLKAAPKPDTSSPTAALGQLSNVGGLAALAGPFKSLGMSPEMVGKMVPEILSYVQGKGGDATKALLANVLK